MDLCVFLSALDRSCLQEFFQTYLVYNDYLNLILTNTNVCNILKRKNIYDDNSPKILILFSVWRNIKPFFKQTSYIDTFLKWYYEKDTNSVSGNINWEYKGRKDFLHISGHIGDSDEMKFADNYIRDRIYHAKKIIGTWWEFDFWAIKVLWTICHDGIYKGKRDFNTNKILNSYFTRKCE